MLRAENRLKGQAEFSRILKEGHRWTGQFLRLAAASRTLKEPRVGIIVSRKVAKKAIERNRIRRIIAHLFMHAFEEVSAYDVVVRVDRLPRKTIFAVLEAELTEWRKKLPLSS